MKLRVQESWGRHKPPRLPRCSVLKKPHAPHLGVLHVAVSRYFLADKLVTHITIEQFLPQKKPRHYEHVVLNVVDS